MDLQLHSIISMIYLARDISKINVLLEKYKLDLLLKNVVEKVQSEIKHLQTKSGENRQSSILSISVSFLASVNNKLAVITIADEKRDLELLISDISNELLSQLLKDYRGNKTELLNEIIENLKTICELNGYDYDALLLIFQAS